MVSAESSRLRGRRAVGGWRRSHSVGTGRPSRSCHRGICKAQAWPDQVRVEQDVAIGACAPPIHSNTSPADWGPPNVSRGADARRSCRRASRVPPGAVRRGSDATSRDWNAQPPATGRSVPARSKRRAPSACRRNPARRRESQNCQARPTGQARRKVFHRKGRASLTNPEFPGK